MLYFFLWRKLAWRPVLVSGLLVLSLMVLPAFAFAQETVISDEVQAEVEQELVTSAEAVKDTEVDIKQELDLPANFDPVVPNNFVNSLRYGFKKFGRNVQKAAYKAFASDQKEAQLIKKQADKALAEAVKLQSLDPDNEKVVGIVEDYKSKLGETKDKIEKIRDRDSDFAKQLAAQVAEDNLFVAPKVLSSIQENLFAHRPEAIPDFVRTKEEALAVASEAVLKASGDSAEAAEAFKIAAFKQFKTPFSGIAAADALAAAKEHFGVDQHAAFDEAIKASLENVENNLQTLPVTDELKARTFQRYVEQLPGTGVSRIRVVEQFRSSADLPPVMIEKMTEMKARMVGHMSKRIEQAPSEAARKAITEAMFQFKDGKVEDLKLMNEIKDIVPSQEVRQHMQRKHEESVNKFLNKFGNDQNAKAVTAEFQALNRKVESGEMVPDANFFKTLEGLKSRLSPEQQKFISETEEAGKQEMIERMKQDRNFAQRLGSFNPADIEFLEKVKRDVQGEVADFESKFRAIERQQAENFRKLLDVQDDPEKIREFKQHFEQEIPEDIKKRFEGQYEFKFEDQYQKFEERARERNEFFQEKFGKEFPGQQQFPGQGFGFPHERDDQTQKPRLIGPPVCADGTVKTDFGCEIKFEKKEFKPAEFCAQKGGTWRGSFCEFSKQQGDHEGQGANGEQSERGPRPGESDRPQLNRPGQPFPGEGEPFQRPFEDIRPEENFRPPFKPDETGVPFRPPEGFKPTPEPIQSPQSFHPPSDFKSPAETPPPTFQPTPTSGDVQGAYTEAYPDLFKFLFDRLSSA
ncbi:MAG: hypothetical protein HY545_02360 [Candidatus Doudnabacteria bacterium]|nr:hypothetical protein [Candidatus Doudnabacteria bacterium]